jgi:hypothetical protein
MKKKTKKIVRCVAGFFAVVAVFLTYVALKPSTFHVERRMTINAPAAMVFQQINNFHNWNGWSPWAKMDPNAKNQFSGAEAGTGASFSWQGNKNVGEGKMTIIGSNAPTLVRIQLDFLKPFPGTSVAEFNIIPQGSQSTVTWKMDGNHSFIPKIFATFCNMDKMIGENFESGLASIKGITESSAKKQLPY